MSHIKNDHLLNIAVESGLAASDIIMEALDKPHITEFKGITNLVTDTDYHSEKIIKSIIHNYFPDHNILAEESNNESENKSDYLWIIDPLDGTTNFVHGYPSFAVSIGVYFKNIAQVAVIVEMPNKKLFSAIKGQGAWCEGIPIQSSITDSIEQALLITGFGYNHDDKWDRNMKLFRHFTDRTQGVRRSGSAAIDLCHIASGYADGFWEYDLKPWDTAAGILIAQEAGCIITNLHGQSYDIYGDNILVTNEKIHEKMLYEINPYLN